MKKIVEIDPKSGMESLLGARVLLMCMNYFYVGKLMGVNRSCVLLHDASIVYETGDWSAASWKDAQSIKRSAVYVRLAAIESFMPERG